jgi:hypothetical protein
VCTLAYLGVGEPRGEFTQDTGQLVVGPRSRFLSHAGGFVPYASHRMAAAIIGDTGRSPADSLDDFSPRPGSTSTALSCSAAALPTLLAFAKPGHITFGSDWPFAPVAAGKLFAPGLETYSGMDTPARDAIEATNALALFPRLGTAPAPAPPSAVDRVRHFVSRCAMRAVSRLISTKWPAAAEYSRGRSRCRCLSRHRVVVNGTSTKRGGRFSR